MTNLLRSRDEGTWESSCNLCKNTWDTFNGVSSSSSVEHPNHRVAMKKSYIQVPDQIEIYCLEKLKNHHNQYKEMNCSLVWWLFENWRIPQKIHWNVAENQLWMKYQHANKLLLLIITSFAGVWCLLSFCPVNFKIFAGSFHSTRQLWP